MSFQHLAIDDLKRLMQADEPLTIFDTRDQATFAAGHIEGAQNLTNSTAQQLLDETPMTNKVVVCCYHGISSQGVADWLVDLGYDEVYSLIGGYSGWSASL